MRIAGLALLALLPIPAMLAATCTGKVDSVDTVDGKQTIQLSPRKPNTALSAECKPKLVALPGIAIEKLDPDDAVALDVDAKAGVTRLAVVCSGKIKGTSTGQPANAQKRVELSPSTPSVKLSRACGETLDVPKAKWDEHVGDGDSIELEVEANNQVKKPVLVKQITIPAQGVVQSADPVTGVVAIGDARVDKTFDNKKELVPGLGQPSELIRVSLRDASTKDSLKDFAKGDRVSLRFVFEPDSTPTTSLERIQIRTLAAEGIGPWTKFLLLGGSAGFLCLVAAFLSKWNAIEMFFIGVDQDASKSKTQGALWLVLVLAVFLAVFILRLWYGDWLFGSIAMPTNLALLAGISGISLVGAKAIRVSQEPPTPGPPPPSPPTPPPTPNPVKALMASAMSGARHMTTDENDNPSVGDFQMVLVTLVALVVYLLQVWNYLGTMDLHSSITLPDIDGSLTTLFGISQGGYLGNKMAGALKK